MARQNMTKGAHNGPVDFPSTIWKNGDHWNFIAQGARFTTKDKSFREWTRVVEKDPAAPDMIGCHENGGQWWIPTPNQCVTSSLLLPLLRLLPLSLLLPLLLLLLLPTFCLTHSHCPLAAVAYCTMLPCTLAGLGGRNRQPVHPTNSSTVEVAQLTRSATITPQMSPSSPRPRPRPAASSQPSSSMGKRAGGGRKAALRTTTG